MNYEICNCGVPQDNLEQQESIQLIFLAMCCFVIWISFAYFSTWVKQMLMTAPFLMHLGEMLSKKCSAQEEWSGQPNIAGWGQSKVQPASTAWHQLCHEVWRQSGGCEDSWKTKGGWTNEIQIFLLVLPTERGVDFSTVRVWPSCCSEPHTSSLGCVVDSVPCTATHPVGVASLQFNFLLVLKPAHSYVGRSHLPETSRSTNRNNAEIWFFHDIQCYPILEVLKLLTELKYNREKTTES